MGSSSIDTKTINNTIIDSFLSRKATTQETAVFLEDLKLPGSPKIHMYLMEEFVRNDFVRVLPDGKVYFLDKKWNRKKRSIQAVYILIFMFPLMLGIIMILF